jgi:hypothetical protein
MESTLPHVISPSDLAPEDETGTTPFAQQTVVLTKQAYIELKWQANYWRAQYEQIGVPGVIAGKFTVSFN